MEVWFLGKDLFTWTVKDNCLLGADRCCRRPLTAADDQTDLREVL